MKDKQEVVYPYNQISFGNKEEWNTDPCYKQKKLENIVLSKRSQCDKRPHAA